VTKLKWIRNGLMSATSPTHISLGMLLIRRPIPVLAYVFGKRKDEVFTQLKAMLEPCGISHYDTDGCGAYERYLESGKHEGVSATLKRVNVKI